MNKGNIEQPTSNTEQRRNGKPKRNEGLTQKEAAAMIGCSVSTFRRDRKRYDVRPVQFTGITPVFTPEQVARMEARRIREIAGRAKR